MFFLRCAFWLSIVYASMSWQPGSLAPADVGASLIAAGRTQAETLVQTAATKASDLCTRNPRECLADAARLTSLISASEHIDDASAGEPVVATVVPLPVPDPRRASRDAKPGQVP